MTIERAVRWFAFVAMIGGMSRIGMTPSSYIWGGDSNQELICAFVANILMVFGTFGLYLAQAKEAGKFGFLSFAVMELGLIMVTCTVWSTMLHVSPWEWGIVKSIEIASGMLGLLLFPIASLRARVLPKWPCITLIAMLFIGVVPIFEKIVALLWGVAYIGMGYAVWRSKQIARA
ncbi:hypothetical protein GE107_16395 [Cohnella sp. CFH 77786]|uniref:hypothetical protein n=1 Tax=Cohnella sp. CFH 77786 TaxID=2662265 RepID=UPI001C60C4B8|nr:hypothetical protein [Cohnella sp. CFH 77786]MBW5447639.1 hypothetical protein [Cohnella sp. CFH 77786]